MTDVSVTTPKRQADRAAERQWLRRGELLEAARQVFEREGYHATTVSSIVQAAGLSQGAFYLYFADKKSIFAALQEEMETLLRRRIYWAARNEADPRRRLIAGLHAFFEYYEDYPEWNRRLWLEGLGIDPAFELRQRALHESLAEAFAPTLSELEIRETTAASFALIGLASQLAYWDQFHRGPKSRFKAARLARAAADLFISGAQHMHLQGGTNG
jgi:AcrR family transcriptional regulator